MADLTQSLLMKTATMACSSRADEFPILQNHQIIPVTGERNASFWIN